MSESVFDEKTVKATDLCISTITLQGRLINIKFKDSDIKEYDWLFPSSVYRIRSSKGLPIVNKNYSGTCIDKMKNGRCFNSCFEVAVSVENKLYPVKIFTTGTVGIPGSNTRNYINAIKAGNIVKDFLFATFKNHVEKKNASIKKIIKDTLADKKDMCVKEACSLLKTKLLSFYDEKSLDEKIAHAGENIEDLFLFPEQEPVEFKDVSPTMCNFKFRIFHKDHDLLKIKLNKLFSEIELFKHTEENNICQNSLNKERSAAVMIKFRTPTKKKKDKKTTVKILKSGKINILGAPTLNDGEIYYKWVMDFLKHIKYRPLYKQNM